MGCSKYSVFVEPLADRRLVSHIEVLARVSENARRAGVSLHSSNYIRG